jgi:hypothetical protein
MNDEPIYSVHDTAHGKCDWCGKKAKEKDLFVIKGVLAARLCPEHAFILARQTKEK